MATKSELPHSEPGMSIEEAVKGTIETTQETSEQEQYKEKATEKVKISTYIRIFTYATRWDLFFLFAAILAQIGAGITMPLMNIIFGNLVGSFSNYFTPGSNTTQAEFTRSVNRQTLFFVYIWIAKFSLCYIAMFSLRIVGIRVSAAIRLAYLRALFAQSISVLDTLPPGSAASTITGQANLLQIGISEKLGNFFQNIALLIAAYTIAFVYSWKLTLVTSSLLLFIIITYSGIVPFMIMFQKEKDHADTKAVAIASEVFGAIRMVKACGAEARVAKRFAGWIEESRKRGLKLSPLLGAQFSPFYFAMFADFALTFWYGIHLFIKGEIASVGTVLIVLMSVLLSVMSISQVFVPVLSASKAAGAAASFFAIIDRPRPESQGKRDPEVSSKADIVFNDAVFAYPSRAHVKVLDGLNVTFETGKLTAIVGPSGSGKSTVVGLLERWYDLAQVDAGIDTMAVVDTKEEITERPSSEDDDPTPVALSGSVTIGGHDIRTLNMKWWRAQIGLVQQEPFMFNDTIHANVAYGLVGTQWEHESEEQKRKLVEIACVEAFADEFIDRLPLGYETIVGESGIKLSGGQRQRLAIARSIIKRPQILIFDEATSAIDVRGERKVQAALDQVSKNRTTITIAHRLSTIKKADKIVVVKKGKVIEQGSHEELISTQGVYHDLVFAQSLTMEEPTDEEGLFELAQKKTLSRTDSIPGAHHEKDDVETAIKELVYKPKGVFSSFGLLLIEQKRHLIWLYLTIIGALGAAVAQPMQAYLMAQVISVFESTSEQALSRGASYWALRFLYLAIGVGVAYFIIGWASNSFSMHISCTYRQEYFESITKQPISFFDHEDHSLGTLTSRISSDPTQLQEMMGTNMAMAMTAFFTIIGSIAISFSFGWKLTLVSIFSALPIILSASYYRLRFEIQFEKMNAAVFAESSKFAAEAISAFRTVTSLTLEEMICERYAVLLHDHVEKAVRKARWASLVLALSDSVNLLCMALAFWYGGKLMASHEYTPLIFLIIYVSIVQGSEQAGIFMSFGPNFAQATAAANRILAFRLKDSAKRSYTSMPAVKDMERPGAKLEFRNVAFRYPTREIPIFRNLNLTVAAGQFAALVGPSGCGKTSIISILEQFYPISSGSIHFDGVNLNDLDVDEYRKAFSLVAQEATLFQGSIKDNLLLGVDERSATQEQMEEACRQAEIHTFIESLPEGYRTDIGSRGVALSGGQRQRLSIARALLRNPRVLLLDEATSSLDSESERAVQKAFERAGKGRTMVVVAHRLATVQNADVIFVLGDGGKIAEKGTHKDLVSRRGVYWQMCQSQALDR